MKNYELLYILPASETSEEIVKNFQDVQKHIEKFGGEMLETLLEHPFLTKAGMSKEDEPDEIKALPLVKRKLAYAIKHERFGYYVLVNFKAEGKKIEDIDEYLRLSKKVLRHLITEADPMTREELDILQTLFARKKAEQEKEEAENGKKDDRRTARKENAERKEEKPAETKQEEPEESQVETEEVREEQPAAKEEVKPEEKKEEKKAEAKEEAKVKEPEAKEEKAEKGKKSKIKLEELEDKLDEILEDTIV